LPGCRPCWGLAGWSQLDPTHPALIEAADREGRLRGDAGLLEAAQWLDLADTGSGTIGLALLRAVANHRQGQDAADDVTVVVVRDHP
jgi:hypothetical protein